MEEDKSKILNIEITRKTFDKIILTTTIISIVLLIALIILPIILVNLYMNLKPVNNKIKYLPQNITANVSSNPSLYKLNISSATTKEECGENNNWNGKECICRRGYYGSNCDIEINSEDFYPLGITRKIPDKKDLFQVPNLISCLDKCRKEEDCLSVFYEDQMCSLIKEKIDPNEIFYFRHDQRNNLFTHITHKGIDLDNNNYLFSHSIIIPARFWLNKKSVIKIEKDKIHKLTSFIPKRFLGNKDLIGIYTRFPYKKEDLDFILKKRPLDSMIFLHQSKDEIINIPKDWKLPIYVFYSEIKL